MKKHYSAPLVEVSAVIIGDGMIATSPNVKVDPTKETQQQLSREFGFGLDDDDDIWDFEWQ